MPRLALPTRYYRAVVTVLAGILAAAASLAAGPRMNPIDGLVYDLSLATTDRRAGTLGEPVAVIAIDRDSLASEELAAMPRVFFSPVWAKLVAGLTGGGVKAVGFDVIFSFAANRFADGQYDREFLAALANTRGHVVLARSAQLHPAMSFMAAVLDPSAVADVELAVDADGVYRRITPTLQAADGERIPTFSAALLAQAKGPPPPELLLLAPATPLEAMPTYRLVDVLRCIDRDPAAIRRAFADKIVLVGTNLPEEDRKRAPDRFMPPPGVTVAAGGDGCGLPRLGASDPGAVTVPGVFIHAAAIERALTGNLVRPLPLASRAVTAALTGLVGAACGFLLSPFLAAVAVVLLAFALFGIALLALPLGFWFPVAIPAGGGAGAMVLAYVSRFVAEERRRRRVQNAFSQYLSPFVVNALAESDAQLRLGGDSRAVTVMFADLSGFTALSGRVGPEVLTEVTNQYLGLLVAEVEKTGGYVDKFIGDAVMAIWGAPVPDADHAAHAAQAALGGLAAVVAAKQAADAAGRPGYSVKMGLNSGPAVVGNVGAPGRYNYTAIGETVNIAARLEGVPHDYDAAIVIGPATAVAIGERFVLIELDWVKVKGKEEPLAIYELMAEKSRATPEQLAYPAQYAAALALYRAGDFAAAQAAWAAMTYPRISAEPSTPPKIMTARCAELRADPPAAWDGVFVKTTK